MSTEEQLILVDRHDRQIGTMEKLAAHEQGRLHRAFSLFVFNSQDELLLQRRAKQKYHSSGLWTNTCCSHPRPNEDTSEAVERRLLEEMGLRCEVSFAFSFLYKAQFENGLIEHELDHVYFGWSDETPVPCEKEVLSYRYASLEKVSEEIEIRPEQFTVWFKACFARVQQHFSALAKAG